jgi:hypothetical protein
VFEMLTGQVFLVTLVAGLVKSVAAGGVRSGEQGDDERRAWRPAGRRHGRW